jgi:HK97 family phage portal protein
LKIALTHYDTPSHELNRIVQPQHSRVNPVGPLTLSPYQWTDVQPQPFDTYSHLLTYFVNTWCYACIRAIAEWVSEIPLLVQKRQRVDGKLEWVEDIENDLYRLLQKPNPDVAWHELSNDWITSTLAAGDGYLLYTKDEGGQLWHCQSDWVKVKTNKFGQIIAYHIADRGQSFDLEQAEVIHARLSNPTNAFYGVPPAKVVGQTILTQLYLGNYLNKYFLNNALPGTTFSTDRQLTPEDKERIRQEITRLFAGSENSHRTAVLDQGTKLDRLAHNIKDLMPVELYKTLREEIIAAYGLTHIMISIMDDASYANATIARRVFIENRGLPTLRLLESALNMRLVPFFSDDLRCWYNRSAIPALQEDETNKATRLGVLYHDKRVIKLNEARKQLGLDPDPDGDDYFSGPEATPFGSLSINTASGVGQPDNQTGKQVHNGLGLVDMDADNWYDLPPMQKYRFGHYQKVLRLQSAFQKLMQQFFKNQKDRLLSKLDKITNTGKMMSSLYWYIREGEIISDKAGDLFDFYVEHEELLGTLAGLIQRVIKNNGAGAVAEINTGIAFDIDSPEMQSIMEAFKNRLKNVNITTYNEIKQILKQAYDEGVGINELTKRLTEQFAEFGRARAKRIAQTEMVGMVNGARTEGYRQAGVEYKKWLPAYLPTSRETHIQAGELEPIPLDQQFPVGEAMLDFPGDPSGPPEEVINCYCTLVPYMKEELSYVSDNGHKNRLITLTKGEHYHV